MTQSHYSKESLTARLNRAEGKRSNDLLQEPQHMQCGCVFLITWLQWLEEEIKWYTKQILLSAKEKTIPVAYNMNGSLYRNQPTSSLLNLFDAGFGCGDSSRVVVGGIACEHAVTATKDGANTLLCCFTQLKGTRHQL